MGLTKKDAQFMRMVCHNASIFSTCARQQYYALLVDKHGHTIGTGYNGGPRGMLHCNDGGCPRAIANTATHGSTYDDCIAIHAEVNAIIHSDYVARREGCTLYVNGPPCWDCAKIIANSGVRRVVYTPDSAYKDWSRVASFLWSADIEVQSAY